MAPIADASGGSGDGGGRWGRVLLAAPDEDESSGSTSGVVHLVEQAARFGLTSRELAVVRLLAEGLTATAIGRRLGISPRTVTKHQQNLYRKLEVTDRVTAVLRAQACGLLSASMGIAHSGPARS